MAKDKNKRKAKTVRRHATNRRRTVVVNRKRKNPTRIVVVRSRHNAHRRRASRNPFAFGTQLSGGKLAAHLVVAALGAGVNKLVTNMLPSGLTGSSMGRTVSSAAVAAAEWYLGSMVNKEYGPSFGFGGAMTTVNEALTTYVPSFASTVGISGRGVGDLVPGKLLLPYNPMDQSLPSAGSLGAGAYPSAYPTA